MPITRGGGALNDRELAIETGENVKKWFTTRDRETGTLYQALMG
jgi:hypothetical protein